MIDNSRIILFINEKEQRTNHLVIIGRSRYEAFSGEDPVRHFVDEERSHWRGDERGYGLSTAADLGGGRLAEQGLVDGRRGTDEDGVNFVVLHCVGPVYLASSEDLKVK